MSVMSHTVCSFLCFVSLWPLCWVTLPLVPKCLKKMYLLSWQCWGKSQLIVAAHVASWRTNFGHVVFTLIIIRSVSLVSNRLEGGSCRHQCDWFFFNFPLYGSVTSWKQSRVVLWLNILEGLDKKREIMLNNFLLSKSLISILFINLWADRTKQ